MSTQVGQVMAEAIEVTRLPSVQFPACENMPKATAVYFALDREGAVLYIGRAKNIAGRWTNHHRKDALVGLGCDRVAWLIVDLPMLDITEAAMIHRFSPPLNHTSIKPSGCQGNGAVQTVTTKITPRTLKIVRKIAAETGEKLYAVFERLAENEVENLDGWEPDPRVKAGAGWMDRRHPRKAAKRKGTKR